MIKGFTCGSFDLCHYGHILMFEECKKYCDYLIVGLQSDPSVDRPNKNRPVQTLQERLGILKAIKFVDEIVIYNSEKELYDLLCSVRPDVRILGADWKDKKFTGCDIEGIKNIFNTRDHGYSTSELRKRVYEAELLKGENWA